MGTNSSRYLRKKKLRKQQEEKRKRTAKKVDGIKKRKGIDEISKI